LGMKPTSTKKDMTPDRRNSLVMARRKTITSDVISHLKKKDTELYVDSEDENVKKIREE
jgi:hypothetical protein